MVNKLSLALSLVTLCALAPSRASASTFSTSGDFAADNSFYELTFSESASTNFSAVTTSFAEGGFLPVLTLFNATTGAAIANDGSGLGDASLSALLSSGTYNLFLTEFPNVASGDLSSGFLFGNSPTATGDVCGVSGGTFLNAITCEPTSSHYALTTTSNTAVTPEPATWLLVLPPAAFLLVSSRRRLLA